MLNSPPAFIEMSDEPEFIQAAVPQRGSRAVLSLPRFAYAFVRGHMDSVAALARLLRGAHGADRDAA